MNILAIATAVLFAAAVYCSLESIKPDKPKEGGVQTWVAAIFWLATVIAGGLAVDAM